MLRTSRGWSGSGCPLLLAGVALVVAACAGPGPTTEGPRADASLEALRADETAATETESEAVSRDEIESAIAALEDFQSLDLGSASAPASSAEAGPASGGGRPEAAGEGVSTGATPTSGAESTDTPRASETSAGPSQGAGDTRGSGGAGDPAESVEPDGSQGASDTRSLEARLDAAAQNLEELLLERARGESSPVPGELRGALLRLAAGGDPGVAGDGVELSEPERRVLDALGGALAELIAEAERTGTIDPAAALGALDIARRSVAAAGGMRLVDAAVCVRVRGLGDYDAIEPATFLRGRAIPIVVYAEARGFASEPAAEPARGDGASAGERWRSRLDLSLALYSEADGAEVWRDPGGGAVMTGRRPRSRAHLTAVVTLPARLSVGAYRLKVAVRDRLTGASDERLLPLTLVADPRLSTKMPTSGD